MALTGAVCIGKTISGEFFDECTICSKVHTIGVV